MIPYIRIKVTSTNSYNWYKVGQQYDVERLPRRNHKRQSLSYYLADTEYNNEKINKNNHSGLNTICVAVDNCIKISIEGATNKDFISLLKSE